MNNKISFSEMVILLKGYNYNISYDDIINKQLIIIEYDNQKIKMNIKNIQCIDYVEGLKTLIIGIDSTIIEIQIHIHSLYVYI